MYFAKTLTFDISMPYTVNCFTSRVYTLMTQSSGLDCIHLFLIRNG